MLSSAAVFQFRGAGALSQRERRREESRGGKERREEPEKSVRGMKKRIPAAFSSWELGNDRFFEKGTLRYDEVYFWLAIVL